MTISRALERIRRKNHSLHMYIEGYLSVFRGGQADSARITLLPAIDNLLELIATAIFTVSSTSDRDWLIITRENWQLIRSMLTNFCNFELKPLSEQDIDNIINLSAMHISERRRLDKHSSIIDYSQEEAHHDYLAAEIYFASDIIFGKRDIGNFHMPVIFNRLSRVWLHDVIKLRAYHVWSDKGRPFQLESAARHADFYVTCRQFQSRLADDTIKFKSDSARQTFGQYVSENFLDDSQVLLSRLGSFNGYGYIIDENKIEKLVEQKARRAYIFFRDLDDRQSNFYARLYVDLFYGNLIPALIESARTDSPPWPVRPREISKWLAYHSYVINCFEAAALVYFTSDLQLVQWIDLFNSYYERLLSHT